MRYVGLTCEDVVCEAYGGRAFWISAPKLWDILSEDIKVSPNVSISKQRLQTYLFAEAFK